MTHINQKKAIRLWILYDFANSIASINISFYFALWLVIDNKISDIWVSGTLAIATLFLVFTLPRIGALSDRLHKRMPFLLITTLLTISSLFSLGLIAMNSPTLKGTQFYCIIFFYFLFQFFYQCSMAFYHSFLHELATNGITKEQLSGWGGMANNLGNIVGLLLVLPIAQNQLSFLGATGRAGIFLVSAILFFIFVLPVLLFLKDKHLATTKTIASTQDAVRGLRHIHKTPGLLVFLIAYYLFADAILTIQLFSSLFLEKVGGLTDAQKTTTFILAVFFAACGALLSGKLSTLLKGTKKAISLFLLLWAVFITCFAFSTQQM